MNQQPVKEENIYQDIEYQVGSFEGYPITEVVTADEQRDFVNGGYGTVSELIDSNISNYRDWQCDC
jgi:hypothetical protein